MTGAKTPEVSIRLLLRVVRRRALLLILAPLFAAGVAGAVWPRLPRAYESSARVVVQDPQSANPFLGDLVVEWNAKERVPHVTAILSNPTTLTAIAREVGLVHGGMDEVAADAAVRAFRERLQVIPTGGGAVLVKFRGDSPGSAFDAVDATVRAFVREMLRPQRENVRASEAFLRGELDRSRAEVAEIETRITGFRTTHVGATPEMHELNVRAHDRLRTDLVAAELRVEARKRQKAAFEERLAHVSPRTRLLEPMLLEAEGQLVRAETARGPEHPQVLAARDRVARVSHELSTATRSGGSLDPDALEAQLGVVTAPLDADPSEREPHGYDPLASDLVAYRQVLRDLEGANAEVALLRERLSESTTRLGDGATTATELARLERELGAKLKIYEELLEKYEKARVVAEMAKYDEALQVWVVEPPTRPTRSTRPPLPLVLASGLVSGLVFALLLIAALEAFGSRVRTAEEARRILDTEVALELPARSRP